MKGLHKFSDTLQKKEPGGSSSRRNLFAKTVRTIVIASKLSKAVEKSHHRSPLKSVKSPTLHNYDNHLEPTFGDYYRFTYSSVVDAAIEKYSHTLSRYPELFNFRSSEVKIVGLTNVYKDYSLMNTLKERDNTSLERRIAWSYSDSCSKPPRCGPSGIKCVNLPSVTGSKNLLSVDNMDLQSVSRKSSARCRSVLGESPLPSKTLPQIHVKKKKGKQTLSKTALLTN